MAAPAAGRPTATAFIGLGAMGLPMARNLAAAVATAEQPLVVYNRSPAKAAALARSAVTAPTAAAAAAAAGVVHLMLADDAACEAVLAEILRGDGGSDCRGLVLVNHSTVHPDCTKRLAAAAAAAGALYVAAPVFGRPDAAAAKTLLVVPAGPPDVLARVAPNLQALGRVLPAVGTEPEKANVLKLTGNFFLAGIIEMLSEGLAMAEKHGVAGPSVLGLVEAFFPAPPMVGYAGRIVEGQLDAGSGFTVNLALKDARYIRQLAESARAPMPIADLAFNHLLSAAANGHGNLDWGAISLAVRQEAGLPIAPAGVGPAAGGRAHGGSGAGDKSGAGGGAGQLQEGKEPRA